ncbi:hypothetical protein POX_d05804 [Penicillium oxalicum]|uniref:Uncharacterized protein n=1 Tax=Penicillium oxalicum (strain 114-2 / CGMCC 5302) TaxID=933388 RepID=S7ZTD3_PENO1|nr:hypothetical protein POX_d05804 [Penicillium oxalicum]EPS32021.1 hypothetical protein PDE_06980 [Penicillium oxalicum 114-2]KAI2790295.1 hypothetical protein POX_d05804 [Penicillium oxalicum]
MGGKGVRATAGAENGVRPSESRRVSGPFALAKTHSAGVDRLMNPNTLGTTLQARPM